MIKTVKRLLFISLLVFGCGVVTEAQTVTLANHHFTGDANGCNQHLTCTNTLGWTQAANHTLVACFTPEGSTGFVSVGGLTGGETWVEANPPTVGSGYSSISVTAWAANSAVTTTATGTSGNTTMTVASATGILVGQIAVATGIPTGDNVIGISGTTITLAVKLSANLSSTSVSFESVVLTASNSLPTAGTNILKLSGFTTTTALNSVNNVVISATSTSITIGSTVSGSNTETGTAQVQFAQQLMQAGHYYSNDCWYALNTVGGETAITATFINQTPANITNMSFFVLDYSCTGTCTTRAQDAVQVVTHVVASQCSACSIAALTITGTYDICVQVAEFGAVWSTSSSVSPYTERDNDTVAGNTIADDVGQSGTCPSMTWTQTSSNVGLFSSYGVNYTQAAAGLNALPGMVR